jgi:hypothetical protein
MLCRDKVYIYCLLELNMLCRDKVWGIASQDEIGSEQMWSRYGYGAS